MMAPGLKTAIEGDLEVEEYWGLPPAGSVGWSPGLMVLAGVSGLLMWGGLLLAVLQVLDATSGVVHGVGAAALTML